MGERVAPDCHGGGLGLAAFTINALFVHIGSVKERGI